MPKNRKEQLLDIILNKMSSDQFWKYIQLYYPIDDIIDTIDHWNDDDITAEELKIAKQILNNTYENKNT